MTVLSQLLSSSSFKSDEGLMSGCCGWTGEWPVNHLVSWPALKSHTHIHTHLCACVLMVFMLKLNDVGALKPELLFTFKLCLSRATSLCAAALWPTAAEPAGRKLAGQPPSQQCHYTVCTRWRSSQLSKGLEPGWMHHFKYFELYTWILSVFTFTSHYLD